MAIQTCISFRGFSRTTPASLPAVAIFLFLPLLALAAQGKEANDPSGYNPSQGTPFFVLTDMQYGSSDNALLRVEIPASSGGLEAAQEYGGVEVRLYRAPKPLEFLKAQKNLHRIDTSARLRDGGIANTISYLWSNLWNKARRAWRSLFSSSARKVVTATAPALKTSFVSPRYKPVSNFRLLENFEIQQRFRYPLHAAKPIAPPKVELAGSSSNFLPMNEGNFHVPLGRLKPGLYIAEAIIGMHRAVTPVFVSNTVTIVKMSSGEMTVWAAHRANGSPVANAKLQWTDGRGVLASAVTDKRGLAIMKHAGPECTYLLGEDAEGGVFVSENFYYDSEIYDTKLYAITDRPLYRPGDMVNIKLLGRDYRSATESFPAKAGEVMIQALDPNGTPVLSAKTQLTADTGADTSFRLPDDAVAGGYEIRMTYQGKRYGAAFRVVEYVKPHFEITLTPDRDNFKTGEPVSGKIRLAYPDGKPVKNAAVELLLRAQTLTMVQGELGYSGLFPVELSTASLTSDDKGEATFSLPPVKVPSRLVLSMLATDGAAYRVRTSRELLVERAAASWRLVSSTKFTMPKDQVTIRLEPENPASDAATPATWEIVRLENRKKRGGRFDAKMLVWKPQLNEPGSYSLMLRDASGNLVGATAHWVGGEGIQALPGTIDIVANKERYRPGETASMLLTFSEPVDQALLTLERDKVEATALLSDAKEKRAGWIVAERLAPNQWRARIPVKQMHAPNMTFSAAYVKNGEYVFQNAGIVVESRRIELSIKPDKTTVQPGETVTVDIAASLEGKSARAMLTVSVVDEMIYALQPEIAPDIVEFFHHMRRNNVRTGASLNFITYDEAVNYSRDSGIQASARHQYNERGVKMLERARRDDTDTAAWLPTLLTDAAGKARFSFRMPDALSRWRITVRAIALPGESAETDGNGIFGQRICYVKSDKDLYAKWTSPTWMREWDWPVAQIAVFNNSDVKRTADVVLTLNGKDFSQQATLSRGVNYLSFNLPKFTGRASARLEVREKGKVMDALETGLETYAPRWRGERELVLPLARGKTEIKLPSGARNLRLRFVAGGGEHFLRISDSLIEYPWGCAEQTSSRLIPLAIITPLLAPDRNMQSANGRLWQMLYSQRLRLASLAGPNAVFGWWGDGAINSAFISAYAYYADWHAVRTLGLQIPAGHWEHLLEIYREHAHSEPLLQQALALWFMQQIGLPTRTQVSGLTDSLQRSDMKKAARRPEGTENASPILTSPDSPLGLAYVRVLVSVLARADGEKDMQDKAALAAAVRLLESSRLPSAHALLLLAGRAPVQSAADILASVSSATPTIDRALTLVWTRDALGGSLTADSLAIKPAGEWQSVPVLFGRTEWRWTGDSLPQSLQVENAPSGTLTAILHYDAEETAGKNDLPAVVSRRLFRLERRHFKDGRASYAKILVKSGEVLSTQELYLDEVHLASSGNAYQYGVMEASLPPGAFVEHSTWGIQILDGEESSGNAPLERSRAEEKRDSYGVPVELLTSAGVTIRHLLRLGQTGRFILPPARYYRMYQPERKAYADGGRETEWNVR
jgi:alpha-2-macroglobulin